MFNNNIPFIFACFIPFYYTLHYCLNVNKKERMKEKELFWIKAMLRMALHDFTIGRKNVEQTVQQFIMCAWKIQCENNVLDYIYRYIIRARSLSQIQRMALLKELARYYEQFLYE